MAKKTKLLKPSERLKCSGNSFNLPIGFANKCFLKMTGNRADKKSSESLNV